MSSSALNSIRATDHAPAKLRGEISAKQQTREITDAITETLKSERGVVKCVEADSGITAKRLYALADANDPAKVTADEVVAIVRCTRNYALLDVMEKSVGRLGFRLPVVHPDEKANVLAHTTSAIREFGQAVSEVSAFVADGLVTADERKEATEEIDQAMRALAELQACLQQSALKKTA